MNQISCPNCASPDGLWEGVEVPGWRSIRITIEDGKRTPVEPGGFGDREAFWAQARPDGTIGCGECSWEGTLKELIQLDNDGNEVVPPNPDQLTI